MTWFKVDDSLAFHAKTVAAGNPAMGLWVRAGSWCAQQLTDGHVPNHMVQALGTTQQAKRLVAAGLWAQHESGDGYAFHEWNAEGRQPLRSEVEVTRSGWREKKRKQRRSANGTYSSPGESPGDNIETPPGSPSVPSRPVPSRPEDSPNGESVSPRRKPERPLPEGWAPNDGHTTKAAALGLDLNATVEAFRDHAAANDRRARDWDAAFRTWLTKAAEYAARDASRAPRTSDRQGLILQEEMRRAREHDAAQTRWEIEA